MALEKLAAALNKDSRALIMLEYSDNVEQVSEFQKTSERTLSASGNYFAAAFADIRRAYGAGNVGSGLFVHTGKLTSDESIEQRVTKSQSRFAFIIPVYNHAATVAQVVRQAQALGYPVFVVDDGSTDETSQRLAEIKGINLLHHSKNEGKGAAILTGFMAASHVADYAITIDADGQH